MDQKLCLKEVPLIYCHKETIWCQRVISSGGLDLESTDFIYFYFLFVMFWIITSLFQFISNCDLDQM